MTQLKALQILNSYIKQGGIQEVDLNKLDLLLAMTTLSNDVLDITLNSNGKLEFRED